MSPERNPFDAHPHYAERLRADFEELHAAPELSMSSRLDDEAKLMLTSLLAIEDCASVKSDEDKESAADLARVERKLDLMLELLSMRLMDGQSAPECQVQLSAAGARWQVNGSIPAPGAQVIASIYVHRFMPRPLRLPAEVVADQPGWLCLLFKDMSEGCEELLARHVFQQHRRQLAGARRMKRGLASV